MQFRPSLHQAIILQLPLLKRLQKSHPLKLTGKFSFGFTIHFLSTAKQVKIVLQAILVRSVFLVWAGQAYMDKSCSHSVHKSQMKRGRSEANPSPPHAGTGLDAKWSLPVMGQLPAEKLGRWWPKERLYRFSCENENLSEKKSCLGQWAFNICKGQPKCFDFQVL